MRMRLYHQSLPWRWVNWETLAHSSGGSCKHKISTPFQWANLQQSATYDWDISPKLRMRSSIRSLFEFHIWNIRSNTKEWISFCLMKNKPYEHAHTCVMFEYWATAQWIIQHQQPKLWITWGLQNDSYPRKWTKILLLSPTIIMYEKKTSKSSTATSSRLRSSKTLVAAIWRPLGIHRWWWKHFISWDLTENHFQHWTSFVSEKLNIVCIHSRNILQQAVSKPSHKRWIIQTEVPKALTMYNPSRRLPKYIDLTPVSSYICLHCS